MIKQNAHISGETFNEKKYRKSFKGAEKFFVAQNDKTILETATKM